VGLHRVGVWLLRFVDNSLRTEKMQRSARSSAIIDGRRDV
jgi:hypothetical protein